MFRWLREKWHSFGIWLHDVTNNVVDFIIPPGTWIHEKLRAICVFIFGEWSNK